MESITIWFQKTKNKFFIFYFISYNSSASIVTWDNMSSLSIKAIDALNYNSTRDEARIDLLMRVPQYESSGTKESIIYVRGELH